MDIDAKDPRFFEARLKEIENYDTVVIIEGTDGYDVDFSDIDAAMNDVLDKHLSNVDGTDVQPSDERFIPLDGSWLAKDYKNGAYYMALPSKEFADRLTQVLQEKFGNALTYTVTDGGSAKTRHLEELEGGMAVDDVTGYIIG